MPTPQPKRAEGLTPEQLRVIADELAAISGIVLGAMAIAESNSDRQIAVYNYPSGIDGLKRLKTFSAALDNAVFLAKTGRPLAVGEHKPRYKATSDSTPTKKKIARKKRGN